MSLSSINPIEYRRSGSGPANGTFQYQIGSGSFTDLTTVSYTNTTSTGASLSAVDLSLVSALQNIASGTTVTFRIINYSTTAATGSWYLFDVGADTGTSDFSIQGTLTAPTSPSLTWSRTGGGTWDTSSLNFTSDAAAWSNTANATDKAIFPSANQNITVATGIVAGSLQFAATGIVLSGGTLTNGNTSTFFTVDITNSPDTTTISTSINDGGKGLKKDGAGTLVLSGIQTDLTGGVIVANGTLQTEAGIVSGKNITNNATLELTSGNYMSGTITNNGTLLKSNSGTLTISTAMAGIGATNISGGTLTAAAAQSIATGALTIALGATLDLSSNDATVASITLTGGSIANSGTITLAASGSLTTVASSTQATISGSSLALGTGGHSISIPRGTATSDLTISAALTGSGTLTKSGNGTLTLSGDNSGFSGTISHGNGTITAATANALGVGQLNFNGGTLAGNGSALTLAGTTYQLQGGGGTLAGASDLTLNGNWSTSTAGSLNLTVTNTASTTVAGTFTSSGTNKNLTTNVATNLTMSGIIASGAGFNFTKSGTGTLTLSGANTYIGNTTVTNGTLKLGASNVIADVVNVIINAIAGATATFDLDGNSDTFASLTFGGTSGTATSTSNLSTDGGTLTLGGNLTYDASNHPLGSTLSGKLDLGASRTFAIGDSTNAATDLAVSASISGTGFSLTKTGIGTLALSGTNTYSGGTTVSAGFIAANSSSALGTGVTTIDNTGTVAIPTAVKINSNFTVNSGGTLTGTGTAALGGIVNGPGGTLAGNLTFASGSSLAPGSSPGLLSITGAVTFESGSRYTWELSAFSTATPGTNFDQVIVANGGSLSLLAGATLVPTFTGTATSPTASNGFWTNAQTWTVVTNSGGTGTVTGTAFAVDNSAWSGSGNFAAAVFNNEVLLTWTPSAIPEPSTYAAILGALALGATVWHRRQRSRR